MLLPLIDRVAAETASVADERGDASFVGLRLLETRGVRYAFHLPTNKPLAKTAEPHIYRPPGR